MSFKLSVWPQAAPKVFKPTDYNPILEPILTAQVRPARGLFITFEGVEGAGKTTQIKLLKAALETRSHEVHLTREPGGDAVSETVRHLVLHNEVGARAELLLFLASRANNVEAVIQPALRDGKTVICDRFIDSSVAYQGCGRRLGRETVVEFNRFATSDLIPDITFLLDIDPLDGLARQKDRNRMESEAIEFHNRVREGFLTEAENNPIRFRVIDASGTADDIHEAILSHVVQFIASHGS